MKSQKMRNVCVTLAAAIWVIACGGGSDSTSLGGQNPPPGGGPVGGITRTGIAFAAGPVTTFGSVVVNGITYDTSNASFNIDGEVGTQADLSVGDFVLIQGTIDDDNTNAVAQAVSFDDNVEGPVSSVDMATKSFVVLGQTVFVSADTSIDDSCPAALSDLVNVAAVEVSGLVAADGSIAATRIECKAIAGELEVTGIVSSLGTDTFMINALVVDYTSVPALLEDFPAAGISEGDLVEAKGNGLNNAGELVATRVELKGNLFDADEGDHAEIEGFITRFTSETDFDVSGFAVTTIPGTTVYEGGQASDLGMNIKVEVEGEFDANGVLVATKVDIRRAKAVRITALVDSVASNSIVMLGITINTDALTRFEDKSNQPMEPFGVGDIAAGNYVEVRGQEMPAGSGEVLAAILERDDPDTETELQGFIETNGVSRPTIRILGVTIETNPQTVYRDENDVVISNPDDFWNRIQDGSLIGAKGLETSAQTIVASEVEIEIEN